MLTAYADNIYIDMHKHYVVPLKKKQFRVSKKNLWDQVHSSTIRKKLDATKPEFKVLISCILVANTTPNQQVQSSTSIRLAMALWMCIKHMKVRLLYTNIEILAALKIVLQIEACSLCCPKNCPVN
jgi:hypothetical protein